MRLRRAFALSFDSEFSLNFGDADAESDFDLHGSLGLPEVPSVIEALQAGTQIVEEFAGKAVTPRETILSQNRCAGAEFVCRLIVDLVLVARS